MREAAAHLPFPWRHAPPEIAEPRGPIDRQGHIGPHKQAQPGFSYIGIVPPVGRLTAVQLRGLAAIAEQHGSAMLRLTVWQTLLVSDIPDPAVDPAIAEIEALGLGTAAGAIRASLIACTGNAGCRFALADTKRHALALADQLDRRFALDTPLNIALAGCPNSCAQHDIGDIGLLATKVDAGDDEVEGYHIHVGGGSGAEQRLGRMIFPSVPAAALPARIEAILRFYLAERRAGETFHAFAARHSDADLAAVFAQPAKAA
jgi:ferredoxin-nitrite reductase